MKENFKKSGEVLKRLRVRAGLSQAKLAKKLKKVHVQFVSNWERGQCAPPQHCHKELAKILKMSTHDKYNYFLDLVSDKSEEIKEKYEGLV